MWRKSLTILVPIIVLFAGTALIWWILPNAKPRFISFSTVDLEGKPFNIADYRGKWVVVNFWATWCPSCLKEIPDLNSFQKAHKDALVIGINAEDEASREELVTFVHTHAMSYPILRATDVIFQTFGVLLGLPTTYILDPNGKIVSYRVGEIGRDYLEERTGH